MGVKYVEKRELNKYIKRKVKPARVIIDIGCGINPQNIIRPKVHICVEPHIEYVQRIMNMNPFENYVCLNITGEEALKLFPDKSIDSIFMLDLIEHINKDAGFELLQQCERVTKKQIIVFTPLGFFPQKYIKNRKDLWGMDGGLYQEHKSGWDIEDFDDTWDLTCVKEYHFDDGYGNVFDKPYGVIFAIKNFKNSKVDPSKVDFILFILKKLIPPIIRSYAIRIKNKIIKSVHG
jgi:hypothetical protein